MAQPSSNIACLGGPKEAALYFDRVFPIDLATSTTLSKSDRSKSTADIDDLLAVHVPPLGDSLFNPVIESLLGGRKESVNQYIRQSLMGGALLFAMMAIAAKGHTNWAGIDDIAIEMAESASPQFAKVVRAALRNEIVGKAQINGLNREIQKAVVAAGYGDGPTWSAPDSFTIFGSSLLPSIKEDSFFGSLSGLQLIDAKSASWESIIEFRKDEHAKAALRDLRIFFATDLNGKTGNEIEDVLMSRIFQHDEAVRRWGFETANRTFGVLFSKENAVPAFGAMSAAILGAPIAASAAGAAAFAIGSCAVEFGRAKIERRQAHLENPIRYLVDLKTRLAS